MKEQDRRRKKRQGDQIYDVTAWEPALAFDVECVSSTLPLSVKSQPLAASITTAARTALAPAKVAYMLPWGFGAAAAVTEALRPVCACAWPAT